LWIIVDSNNVIQHAQDAQPTTVPTGQTVYQIDNSLPNAQYLYGNPTAYEYVNGQIIQRPYFSLGYSNNTVTATLELPPSSPPSSVTFTVAGQNFIANLMNNTATLALAVHPSLASQQVIVTCSASGCVSGSLNLTGGTRQDVGLQVYTPPGGIPTVMPVGPGSVNFLSYYYGMSQPEIVNIVNAGVADNLLADVVFNIILPALQKPSYTPISLDANQQNTLADIQKNLLPNIYTRLENAYPSGGTPQVQYVNMVQGFAAAYQAFASFIADVTSIPGLE